MSDDFDPSALIIAIDLVEAGGMPDQAAALRQLVYREIGRRKATTKVDLRREAYDAAFRISGCEIALPGSFRSTYILPVKASDPAPPVIPLASSPN